MILILMSFLTVVNSYLEFIIGVPAVIVILWKPARSIFNGLRNLKRSYEKLAHNLDDVDHVHDMVKHVYTELSPNGGGSIKDKINRIEKTIDEESLKTTVIQNKLQWLLNIEDKILFTANNQGEFTWVNKKFKQLVKRDDDFIIGYGWKNVIHDEDRDSTFQKWIDCVKQKIDFEDTVRICNSDQECYDTKFVVTRQEEFGYMGFIKVIGSDDTNNNDFF